MNRRIFAIHGGLAGAKLLLAGGEKEDQMKNTIDNLMMLSIAVTDMPKSKAFYADQLGFKVTTDSRRDDHNWWVRLALPEGGPSIVLTTAHENMKPGTMKMYFATSDAVGAQQALIAKGAKASAVKDDLFGPGSGVKWFRLEDPDGNQVMLVQPRGDR